jgi:putative transposase
MVALTYRANVDKAQCKANVFVDRRRRSLGYAFVLLRTGEVGTQAKATIGQSLTFSNHRRPHTAHGG